MRLKNGKAQYAPVETTEKQPKGARLVAKGPAGHGSRPLRTNAVVHLAKAVETIAAWDPPMRFNDTTRYYFEKMATVSSPEEAARFKGLFDAQKAPAVREYLAEHDPISYSMLHTSISPNIIKGGYQVNVIPSEAEATLDIRALPGENIDAFYEHDAQGDQRSIHRTGSRDRESAPRRRALELDSDAYHAVEEAYKAIYGVITIPVMSTGATDMAFLRAKGVQCYGVGAMVDEEDAPKGYGPHSDQERILEQAVYKHVQFFWQTVNSIAGSRH